jgi:hypothetical protein
MYNFIFYFRHPFPWVSFSFRGDDVHGFKIKIHGLVLEPRLQLKVVPSSQEEVSGCGLGTNASWSISTSVVGGNGVSVPDLRTD